MNIHEGIAGLRELPPGSVLSIGNFDGVHRGHLAIVERARELTFGDALGGRHAGGRVAVVTFEPHPLTVLKPGRAPPRLSTPAQKRALLSAVGVDDLVVLPPSRDVLDLTAEQFWQILRDDVRPAHLVEGDTFTFGKDRGGTIDRLREWCASSSVALHVVERVQVSLLDVQVVDVNSSLVRWLLQQGRVRDAAICLARPYSLDGTVVEGAKRGRTIGIPTANLQCAEQLVPGEGVYAARCLVDRKLYPVALSIGTTPTFDGTQRQVEAHLIGFDGDLYGRTLSVDLIDWVREQRKFPGIDALKSQLERDLGTVKLRARLEPSRAIASI